MPQELIDRGTLNEFQDLGTDLLEDVEGWWKTQGPFVTSQATTQQETNQEGANGLLILLVIALLVFYLGGK